MKRIILVLMVISLTVGSAWGKNFEVTKKVDDLTVKVDLDKNPPIVGDNKLTISIKDGSGKNVIDAKVKVDYGMPAMPGMPAMNYKTDAALKGTDYKGKLNFSMAGSWNLTVHITQGEKIKRVKLNVDVK